MVQVLPYVPGFGERFAGALGQAAGNVAEGLAKRQANKNLEGYLNKFREPTPQQEGTPLQQMENVGQGQINAQNIGLNESLELYNLARKAKGDKYADQLLKTIGDERKMGFKERQLESKENIEAHKITADYREKLLNRYEGSKRATAQLDRLETLNEEDELATPALAKIAESFGIPLAVLSNPQSEEFQKVSQDLLSNIKEVFGNKIIVVEVENFLKTIPTLMNSKEGRARIIRDLKILHKGAELQYNAYKEIRKKGGKIPLDIHEQVLDRVEPELEKLSDEFKSGQGLIGQLPDPSKDVGGRYVDEKTGQIVKSNGKEWVRE
jgi:hypothetical protein